MNTKSVHWSFWVIGAVALVWNVMGCINFIWQLSPEAVAGMPETHRAIIDGRPLWATAGFAVGVFGGAIGSILLLLKKPAALYVYGASLLGVMATMIHTLRVATTTADFTASELLLMIIAPLLVALFLLWYALKLRLLRPHQ